MKLKKIHKIILSSLVLGSMILQTNTSMASGNGFNIYYYKRINIDKAYIGIDKVASEKHFRAQNYKSTNSKKIVSYYIEGNKAYEKNRYGKSTLIKNNFVTVEDKTYYAGESGYLLKGLRKIGKNLYYFNNSYVLEKNTRNVLENRLMISDKNGVVKFPSNYKIKIDGINYITNNNGYLKEVVAKQTEENSSIDNKKSPINSSDPLSPMHRLGLTSKELALVINKAFPKNKLIKDNDPALINGFTDTLVELENELGINPFFILGIINAENPILHGKFSKIVAKKNNLMSWTAYDNDPFNKATKFNSYSSAIIRPAKFLSKNYLNPNGRYYVDGTVKGVNKHYATAKNWYKNVNYGMKRLNDAKKSLGL